MGYRLQDHAINLCVLVQEKGPIFVEADQPRIPSIVQFPPALCREELLKRIPSTWLTNYENLQKQFHETPMTFQAPVSSYQRLPNGTIQITYEFPEKVTDTEAVTTNTLPFAQSMVIFPIESETDIPVSKFYPDGRKIYVNKINGHFIWDTASERCDPDYSCDDYSNDDDYAPRWSK